MIPISFTFSGDESAAKTLIRLGGKEMDKTTSLMKFQGLQQLKRVVDVAPGVIIITHQHFGTRRVNIHVEPKRGGDEQVQVICLCNCNFSFGIIVEEQTDKLSGDGSTLYTVLVCHNKTGYVVVKDALASDFSKYIVGQKVLVMPYNEMLYTCCNKTYTATGCMPVKSEELIDDDAWRTTVRILPWRAFTLQKWIEVR